MTRSRFNLHKTCHKYQFAISWQAPIIWNDIPLTVRNNLTVRNFKKNLRLYFSEYLISLRQKRIICTPYGTILGVFVCICLCGL